MVLLTAFADSDPAQFRTEPGQRQQVKVWGIDLGSRTVLFFSQVILRRWIKHDHLCELIHKHLLMLSGYGIIAIVLFTRFSSKQQVKDALFLWTPVFSELVRTFPCLPWTMTQRTERKARHVANAYALQTGYSAEHKTPPLVGLQAPPRYPHNEGNGTPST